MKRNFGEWKVWLLLIFISGLILFLGLGNYGFRVTGVDAASANTLSSRDSLNPGQAKNVSTVTDIKDISPNDYYYASLQNIIERYGINVALPDGRFQGELPLKRGDFVLYLNEALDTIVTLLPAPEGDVSYMNETNDRLERVIKSLDNFNTKIEELKTRLVMLEQKKKP